MSGELLDIVDEAIDLAIAIERDALPWRLEVAPFAQGIGRAARDRPRALALNRIASPQQAAHSGPRIFQRLLEPALERAVEKTDCDVFGRNLKCGIDARLDRPLAQQIRAERMNGSDACFFEVFECVRQILLFRCGEGGLVATCAIDLLAQSQLQLTGGFFGEGHSPRWFAVVRDRMRSLR